MTIETRDGKLGFVIRAAPNGVRVTRTLGEKLRQAARMSAIAHTRFEWESFLAEDDYFREHPFFFDQVRRAGNSLLD